MIKAGIKDVKNNLSRLLARVKDGEVILITERGKPVARIVREARDEPSIHEALWPLVQQGLVVLPDKGVTKDTLTPLEVPGRPVSEIMLEDRR
jgi:prevent-host-death family protein